MKANNTSKRKQQSHPLNEIQKEVMDQLIKYVHPARLLLDHEVYGGLVGKTYVEESSSYWHYLQSEFKEEKFDHGVLSLILYECAYDFQITKIESNMAKNITPLLIKGASDFLKIIEIYKQQYMNISGITFSYRRDVNRLSPAAVLKGSLAELRSKQKQKDETIRVEGSEIIQQFFKPIIENQDLFEKLAEREKINLNKKNKELKAKPFKAKFRHKVSKILFKFLKDSYPNEISKNHIYTIGGKLTCMLGLLPLPEEKSKPKNKYNDYFRSSFAKDLSAK